MSVLAMAKQYSEAQALDDCLHQIAQGERDALGELYRRTGSSVYSFALSMLKDPHDAEDVLHDCYVLVWSAAESYHSHGKPMAWLITITKNLCLKKLNARERSAELPENIVELPALDAVTAEDSLLLRECLASLSREESQIVVLHAVSGFRHREIAALLDLPLATVLSKYNRALKKLRQKLEEGGEGA